MTVGLTFIAVPDYVELSLLICTDVKCSRGSAVQSFESAKEILVMDFFMYIQINVNVLRQFSFFYDVLRLYETFLTETIFMDQTSKYQILCFVQYHRPELRFTLNNH